jgi:hypothetical protein
VSLPLLKKVTPLSIVDLQVATTALNEHAAILFRARIPSVLFLFFHLFPLHPSPLSLSGRIQPQHTHLHVWHTQWQAIGAPDLCMRAAPSGPRPRGESGKVCTCLPFH